MTGLPPNVQGHSSNAAFHATMQAANKANKNAIVVFGSPSCPHCVNLQAALVETAQRLPNVQMVNYNVSADPAATNALLAAVSAPNAQLFDSVPAVFFVKPNGQAAQRYTGERTANAMCSAAHKYYGDEE